MAPLVLVSAEEEVESAALAVPTVGIARSHILVLVACAGPDNGGLGAQVVWVALVLGE